MLEGIRKQYEYKGQATISTDGALESIQNQGKSHRQSHESIKIVECFQGQHSQYAMIERYSIQESEQTVLERHLDMADTRCSTCDKFFCRKEGERDD